MNKMFHQNIPSRSNLEFSHPFQDIFNHFPVVPGVPHIGYRFPLDSF